MTPFSTRRRLPRSVPGAVAGAVVAGAAVATLGGAAVESRAAAGDPVMDHAAVAAPSQVDVAPPSDALGASAWAERADTVSFAEDVLPIFRARCAECHGGEDANGEIRTEVSLNLLEYERVIQGSEFGTVIEPGDAEGSWLLEMVVAGDMPEQGDPVPEEEIALIRAWIEAGAPNN